MKDLSNTSETTIERLNREIADDCRERYGYSPLEKIAEIILKHAGQLNEFKKTIDTLCAHGVAKGAYQDYELLGDVIMLLTVSQTAIELLESDKK